MLGVDQHSAEVPHQPGHRRDAAGSGRSQSVRPADLGIQDSTEWLDVVDRFGIVSERAVLLERSTVVQNLAMPFSLDIEPPSDALRSAPARWRARSDLDERDWDRRLGDLEPPARLKVRLARAIALDPAIVLLEHPSAPAGSCRVDAQRPSNPRVLNAVAFATAQAAGLADTERRPEFAESASRVLMLDPASGRLTEAAGALVWRELGESVELTAARPSGSRQF